MAIIKAVSTGKTSIKHVINYVTKKEKTDFKLCTGINCCAETAFQTMQFTKEMFHKTGGRTFLHYVQSFSPGEQITPELAHNIACELVQKFDYFQNYEVLVATHLDKSHVHSHIVVNSVNFENGHKFQMDKKGLQSMKDLSDSICIKHGLSICEKGQKKSSLASYETSKFQFLHKAKQGKVKSYVHDTAVAVQDALEQATSKDQFIQLLNQSGYSIDWRDNHKYIVFQDTAGNKVRNSNLEKTYGMKVSKEDLSNHFEKDTVKHSKKSRSHSR